MKSLPNGMNSGRSLVFPIKETLDKYSEHPPEQCIIEVLDYWLMLYSDKLTWKDVAHALEELNLHQLSEKILQICEKKNKNEANGMHG
jgi:hypothetical protein